MYNSMKSILIFTILLLALNCPAEDKVPAPKPQLKANHAKNYPKIVLYSTTWCPHCAQVKEYFAGKNIPYENRDVEADPEAMDALLNRYESKGVPVLVIGNDEKVLKGFTPEQFENALAEVRKKK